MAEADLLFERAAAALRAGDAAAARASFRRAAEAGRQDAAVIHANFVASGTGGVRDWNRAIALLRGLAAGNRRSAAELEIVSAMALTDAGDPAAAPAGEVLAQAPHIARFRALFTAQECRYLAAAAVPMLAPAVVIDAASGRQIPDPVRRSDGMGFTAPLENPAVHALNRRIAAASGSLVEQGEPLQVLRYRPGGEYKPHFDAIPGFANQRVLTMLVWLNEDYEGGETAFPVAGLKLKGAPGDAILFRNTGPDGRRDPAAAHAGLPVASGEKLIASRWIRERRYE